MKKESIPVRPCVMCKVGLAVHITNLDKVPICPTCSKGIIDGEISVDDFKEKAEFYLKKYNISYQGGQPN